MGLEPIRRYRHTPLKRARIPIPPPRLGGFSIASVSSSEDQVQYEIQDGVAYVTMNRPQARNALTFAMYERIEALCEQVKDPARNGGRDMAALRTHLDDPLVTWGWTPGYGRAAIPTPRATFLAAWETWTAADAPCPE